MLPKIGSVPINLHRPMDDVFVVKQVQVLSKVRGTQSYVVVTIESSVSVPDPPSPGRAIGIGLGCEGFLSVSSGSFEQRPKFFKSMQRQLSLLQPSETKKQKRSKNCQKAPSRSRENAPSDC